MIIVRTQVDKSPIHGLGIYAKEFIAKGTKVWEFHPLFDLKISPEDFEKLSPAAKEEIEIHMYVPEEGGAFYYETTGGKYMNHSRDPNVDFNDVGYGYALRDIQPGEEMTCDYRQLMHDYSHISYL
ncbi:MAG: SET domain-containing protein [Verrucomicrobiota bacterium]|nr:SET domain-containing protein [Verrucomicrobiota bacterium]